MCTQEIGGGGDGNLRRALQRKGIDAGGDGGKRDRLDAFAVRNLQAVAIGRGQKPVLALFAAVPNRTDGVDDMAAFSR
jgi:hypothetical protein